MATVEELKVTGRKFRIWDAVNNVWKRISYWTKATDVEFKDGVNAEDKISQINTNIATANTNISTANTNITNLSNNKISKTALTFTLSGNDLYITKNY